MRGLAVVLIGTLVGWAAHAQQHVDLLLFGGESHKTFLGCLNCNRYSSSSVCNAYGSHGSKYNADSIWNKYGAFGSKYSAQSPWNKYATDPPVVVDDDGNFYGYLTSNRYEAKRTEIEALVALTDAFDEVDDLDELADSYCGRN